MGARVSVLGNQEWVTISRYSQRGNRFFSDYRVKVSLTLPEFAVLIKNGSVLLDLYKECRDKEDQRLQHILAEQISNTNMPASKKPRFTPYTTWRGGRKF